MKERGLSVDEIAAHLGVKPDTIYNWMERKKLPAHKMGRLWKFMPSGVDDARGLVRLQQEEGRRSERGVPGDTTRIKSSQKGFLCNVKTMRM